MKWHWMTPTMNQMFQPLQLPSSYWSTPPALVWLVLLYPCHLFSQKCNWPCQGKSERSPSLFHHWLAKIYFKTELSHHWLPEIFQDQVSKGAAWEESFISEITDTGNEAKKKETSTRNLFHMHFKTRGPWAALLTRKTSSNPETLILYH